MKLQRVTVFIYLALLSSTVLFGVPSTRYFDPQPVSTPRGENKSGIHSSRTQVVLGIHPFFQHAGTAKDKNKNAVHLGDRLGRLNMLGVFLGSKASGLDLASDSDSISKAYQAIAAVADGATAAEQSATYIGNAATFDESAFDSTHQQWGYYSVPLNNATAGVRFSFDYSVDAGLGISVETGVVSYKTAPEFYPQPKYADGTTHEVTYKPAVTDVTTTGENSHQDAVYSALMLTGSREKIARQLKLDMSRQEETGLEDANISLYWRKQYEMLDKEGDLVLNIVPRVGFLCAIPTGATKNDDALYSLALGNDGFYGLGGQVECQFDFPEMLQFGLGGKAMFFLQEDRGLRHVPSSPNQQGLYPWKTTISQQPGNMWTGYFTLRAEEFIDSLSCFFDYQYTIKERDHIQLTGSNKVDFAFAFNESVAQVEAKMGKDGEFEAQTLHFGLEYVVTPALKFGGAVQVVYTGKNVWKSNTTMLGMSFVF